MGISFFIIIKWHQARSTLAPDNSPQCAKASMTVHVNAHEAEPCKGAALLRKAVASACHVARLPFPERIEDPLPFWGKED